MEQQTFLPTQLPLALSVVKEHLRVETDDEDDLLTAYLEAAAQTVAKETRRALVLTEYRSVHDRWPCDRGPYVSPHLSLLERNAIFLEHPPVREVASITYVDADGETVTLDSDQYQTDLISEPGRIVPAWGCYWPTGTRFVANAITVTYRAGYLIPLTASAEADTITTPGYSPANGTRVRFSTSGGTLPGNLAAKTDYYVVGASGTTWSVATSSGGSAVNLSSAGSGLCFVGELPAAITQAILLLIGHWFWNREAVGNVGSEIALAYTALLNSVRWTL